MTTPITQPVEFLAKIDVVQDELQVVYGWASVVSKDGELVVDSQGDTIEEIELVKAAHDFVTDFRVGGIMHMQDDDGTAIPIGTIVESAVFTEDMQKFLKIDVGVVGWWIGLRVEHAAVWKMVKDGQFEGFSIGGAGLRTIEE